MLESRLVLSVAPFVSAAATDVTEDLGTPGRAANWLITGAGAINTPAFQVNTNGPGEISITSNGYRSGTFVAGASLAGFDGFWYADETFSLPATAVNVKLVFSGLYGNDRAVLELNGNVLGDGNYGGLTGAGAMSFPPGPPDTVYVFTGTTSGTVTTGFLPGQTNTLRLIVNNTGNSTSLSTPTATFDGSGDATDAGVHATLTYTVLAVPTVSVTDPGGVYNGSPYPATDASVTGVPEDGIIARFGDPSLSYSYFRDTTPLAGAPSAVGVYTVVAHYTSDNPDYASADSAPAEFTISAPEVDLRATAIDVTPDHLPAGETTLSYTIASAGSQAAGAFQVNVVLSDNAVIGDADDVVLATRSYPGLDAQASLDDSFLLSLPAGVRQTMYNWAKRDDAPGLASAHVSTSYDYVGIVVDPANAVIESSETNNANQGKGVDKDDVTYFPWDANSSGQITPTDAIFLINRLGQSVPDGDRRADPDGSGSVTPTDAIGVINRLGYKRNLAVDEPASATAIAAGALAGDVAQDLGTAGRASYWAVTGAGATGAAAFQVTTDGPGEISITSNGLRTGSFVSGASLDAFNGFWYADQTFSLPANATNVQINFDGLWGNDRTVLELNGNILGDADFYSTTGQGVMAFPPGPPDVSYTFTGATSGSVVSGFVVGGVNTLRLVVNNTGVGSLTAPTATFKNDHEGTSAAVHATLSYDLLPLPTVHVTDGGGPYNGSPYPATDAWVEGVGTDGIIARFGDITLSYSYFRGTTELAGAPSDVGTYTVVAHYTSDNPKYSSADSPPVAFSIQAATPTVYVTDPGGPYNGSPYPATDASVVGIPADGVIARFGDASLSYTYFRGTTELAGAPSAAGDYAVVAHYTSDNPRYASADSSPVGFAVVGPDVDLRATAMDATPDHLPAGEATVSFTIANAGTLAAGAFDVNVVLSDNAVIGDADDVVVATRSYTGLAGQASLGDSLLITLSNSTRQTMYNWAKRDDAPGLTLPHVSASHDWLAIVVDSANAVMESNESNNRDQGAGVDKDDVTYFPWDTNSSGQVTPTDAIFLINRLGQSVPDGDRRADPDGSGSVTPTDAIGVINRLGYQRAALGAAASDAVFADLGNAERI